MCGICGQFDLGSSPSPANREMVRTMTQTMVHRGPDDEGFHFDGPLGFGFRRLSIIDLDGGHQPMSDPDGSVWIVFNGEIFNFPELRGELEAYGHRFRTRSDTEVIIHGYRQWGAGVFNHLSGMFGAALWDARERRLFLARDAMGIKQVYYRIDGNVLSFGSEIRPLLAVGKTHSPIDPVSLNLFLRYRYTPSPRTIYRGIFKLAPGTMLVSEPGGSRVERWYRFSPSLEQTISDDEATERLRELYRQSMRRHLLSDVPVGLLLSGGVDSALLLALMHENGSSWPTYSVGYGRSYNEDELIDAARTASFFKAPNAQVLLDQETFEDTLPRIVACLEEPIASSSIVPMYFVCKRARQDVKVALIGQGPDELFGGYNRHLGVHYGGYYRSLPSVAQRAIQSVITRLPRCEPLKRGVFSLSLADRVKRFQNVFSLLPGNEIDGLFHRGILPVDAGDQILVSWRDLIPLLGETDELGAFQYLEVMSSLPDELLMYADKISMAHGLEVRVPYLDRDIVEFALSLPARFKVRYGARKWLHKRVSGSHMPQEILRRKKRGFGVNVVDAWFRKSMSDRLAGFAPSGSRVVEFLEPGQIGRLIQEHKTGKNDHHKILFSLMLLDEWLNQLRP